MANELNDANKNIETEKTTATDTKELEARIKQLEAENGKLRQANTNASAEASKFKKLMQEKDDALKAKMSDEERAKVEQENANAALQKELEDLRTERNIAKFTGELVAQDIGMDAETAKSVAEALNAGDTEKVFDGIRKFIVAHDKSLRENALRNNQTLPGGSADKVTSKEEFKAMSLSEMMAFRTNHPDLYEEYNR